MSDEVKAKAGKNGTAVAVGTIVIVFNKGGEKIYREVDLSKGITESVIEAITEEIRRRLGGRLTSKAIAKCLGIGYSTWETWKRKAKNGTPVHRKSLLCKLMRFFNGQDTPLIEEPKTTSGSIRSSESEQARKNRSEGQLRRQAELRKAKEAATTLKKLPSFLFDPNWAKTLTSEQRLGIARTLLLGTDLAEHERLCKDIMAAK